MLLFCLRKDQNVVQVHYDNPFCYDGPEDVVHHSLEGSGAVGVKTLNLTVEYAFQLEAYI